VAAAPTPPRWGQEQSVVLACARLPFGHGAPCPGPTTGGLTVMTAPQTNKRATAKNLLAARITLVEELGDALDAHSKAVAAASTSPTARRENHRRRTHSVRSRQGQRAAAELNSTGLHAPAAPRGRPATRYSVPTNTQGICGAHNRR